MDLLRAKQNIEKFFNNIGITMSYELTEKRLSASGTLTTDNVGDFLFYVTVYPGKSNTASCSMYFNKLPKTPRVNQLLNEFNKNAYLLHACEDDLLILEHTGCRISEDEICEYVADILDELNDNEVISLLIPLINESF
jgi:hypothetical protein